MARFYITTAIAYTNAGPHIGHALEFIQADAIARYRRMAGEQVRFLTGTDEHGTKIMRTAQAAGLPTQQFVDGIAARFSELLERLGVSNDDFIRTSDRVRHWPATQALWRKLAEQGDLYRKSYEGAYCVGHEAFIKPSELVDGLCPLHKSKPEIIREENWFFKLSKYRGKIRELIESGRLSIVPASRKGEMLNLLDDAEDVSFSRPSDQLPWGIPVPDDASQTMYVWADALTNYISALGYGAEGQHMDFWPADVHLIGKDILRFHAMIWPAMLLSAGLEVPKSIYVHGFVTVDGEKMSKTLGNVIDPFELLDRWPTEVVRYFMLREIPSTEDGDFSWKNLTNRYTSDLANGLGNLVQRAATLALQSPGTLTFTAAAADAELLKGIPEWDEAYHRAMSEFRLHEATARVWDAIGAANAYINLWEPWKQEGDARRKTLLTVIAVISHVAWMLQPFMPETAQKIAKRFGLPLASGIPENTPILVAEGEPLFPRRTS